MPDPQPTSPTDPHAPAPLLAPSEPSELDRYKEARKTGVPFVADAAPETTTEATPDQLEAKADPPVPVTDDKPTYERWTDPDTGEQLDMRTRRAKRIKQLVERSKELETRLAEAATRQPPPAERETPRPPPVPRATSDDPEPQEAQFASEADPFTSYHRALARWEGRQEARRIDGERQAVYQREQSKEAFQRSVATYHDRLAAAKTRFPDYDSVMSVKVPGTMSPVMQDAILSSEQGPDLAYWLQTHQDVAKAFCEETLHCTRRDLPIVRRRLELELQAATPKALTPPPPKAPPPAPVLGTGTVSPPGPAGPETTYADWKKQRTWARR